MQTTPESARLAAPQRGSTREGASPRVLPRITAPGCNLAVWRRELPLEVARALAAAPMSPGCADLVLRVGATDQLAALAALVPEAARDWVIEDLRRLTAAFSRASGATAFAACMSFVDSDSCRKFHVDHMRLRLLCTYRGPGTEWLADADVDRAAFDPDEHDWDRANARVVRRAGAVRRARAGDVVLLKGERWPGASGRGAVHRSPPIEALGLTRLVFKLSLR